MTIASRLLILLTYHFWPIWFAGLAGILAVIIWMNQAGLRPPDAQTRAGTGTASTHPALPIACFVAFLAVYLVFLLWKEDFTYEDAHHFLDFSAVGIPRSPSIWASVGRYWPVGYTEYNLISHLSRTATAYLAYGAVQLVVGLWFLYASVPDRSPALRLFALAVLMMVPAFAADFAELTYADRNVTFAVCVLVFCVTRYDRRPSLAWMIPVVLAVYYAVYCKEMSSALFGTFAAARILLKASREGWKSALRSPLEVGIVLACTCFAIQLGIVLANGELRYIHENGYVGRGVATYRYLIGDPLLAVFLIAFAIHVARTLRQGKKFDSFWDALAIGGVLHFCAVSVSGLVEDYLTGPTAVVAVLTLLRLVPEWWSERAGLRPLLAGVVGLLVLVTIGFGTFRLIERKNIVIQTQRVADFVIDFYRAPEHRQSRMYLQADRTEYGLEVNFLAYLSYRGLPVERIDRKRGPDTVVMVGPKPFADEICVSYMVYKCHHDEPRVGDLVVHLALETAPPPELPAGETLQPLFRADPAKFFPSLRPSLAALYRVTPSFRGVVHDEPLPDDWLSVSASQVREEKARSPELVTDSP